MNGQNVEPSSKNEEQDSQKQILESTKYEFKIIDEVYILSIELNSDDKIYFKLRNKSNLSFCYYMNKYTYEEITKLLSLSKQSYKDLKKVFKFFDMALSKKRIELYKENDVWILKIKRIIDFDEFESKLELHSQQSLDEQMFNLLIKEINYLKKIRNENGNQNEHIAELQKIFEEFQNDFKNLEKRVKKLENKVVKNNPNIEYEFNDKIIEENKEIINEQNNVNNINKEIKIDNKKNEEKEIINFRNNFNRENKDNNKKNEEKKEIINFRNSINRENKDNNKKIEGKNEKVNARNSFNREIKDDNNKIKIKKRRVINKNNREEIPKKLDFKYELTNKSSDTLYILNYDLFIGLKDKRAYLIYNNKDNYNLEIMQLDNKKIITSLPGHVESTQIIRYYKANENKDYILSIDKNNLIIIWDIQSNYKKIYKTTVNYFNKIIDAILLLNINNSNYVYISNSGLDEYSQLYELKIDSKFKFIRNINDTNNNKTKYLIPWNYNNEYYIIECCDQKIMIYSIFEDKSYAELFSEPESDHISGFIYNQNFLCVIHSENKYIRIWDLKNKAKYNEISYNADFARQIIPYKNTCAIIGCKDCIVIVNIEEEELKKFDLYQNNGDKDNIIGIKMINCNKLGECLIGSCENNSIKLFSFQNN